MPEAEEEQPGKGWRSERIGLLVLLAATACVRLATVTALGDHLSDDPDAYANLAVGVHDHGVLGFTHEGPPVRPTAVRPPLYPLLLAPLVVEGQVSRGGVAALHVLMGVLTVWLVARLGARWLRAAPPPVTGSSGVGRWPLVAAGAVAVDPLLLNQSALVMSETLAVLLAAAALLALTRLHQTVTWFRCVVAGWLLGLAMLCRPTFAPWAALSVLLCLLLPVAARRRLLAAGLCAASAALVLAPWAARNYQQLGKPILATTHGGYTLLLANNPHFYVYLTGRRPGPWDARELQQGMRAAAHAEAGFVDGVPREIQRDQLDNRLAWRTIRHHPHLFLRAASERLWRLWGPLPQARSADESLPRRVLRSLTGAWYAAWTLLALAGLVALGHRLLRLPWAWGMALCLTFTAVHLFYWTDFRMRAPLLPVVYLLAVVGLARLVAAVGWRKEPAAGNGTFDL